jgi:hypothetical protein
MTRETPISRSEPTRPRDQARDRSGEMEYGARSRARERKGEGRGRGRGLPRGLGPPGPARDRRRRSILATPWWGTIRGWRSCPLMLFFVGRKAAGGAPAYLTGCGRRWGCCWLGASRPRGSSCCGARRVWPRNPFPFLREVRRADRARGAEERKKVGRDPGAAAGLRIKRRARLFSPYRGAVWARRKIIRWRCCVRWWSFGAVRALSGAPLKETILFSVYVSSCAGSTPARDAWQHVGCCQL